jgi:hypothetical protein
MPTATISLSSRAFERCRSIFEKDFVFIGHNFEYKCTRFEACFLSPRVCELLETDRSLNSMFVEYEGNDGQALFEIVGKLIGGERVEFLEEQEQGLLVLSRVVGNDKIEKALVGGIECIDIRNVCTRLIFEYGIGVSVEEEIEFAASHFYEIGEESLRKLPIDILETILSCEGLRLKNEDSLLEFIQSVEHDRNILYRYLKCEYLSCEGIKVLLEDLNADSLDYMIWTSICRRLILSVCELSKDSENVSKWRFISCEQTCDGQAFVFVEGFEMKGIISFLSTKCGGNIHTNGLVTISSSGDEYNHCWQVADHGWTSYRYTKSVPNSWISFDFKNRRVSLSHYTLKSHPGTMNFFIAWVIEGSNDSGSWTELDRRSTRDLVGASIVKTYSCSNTSSTSFRYLRMRQTGPTSHNFHYLILTNIEFFGQLHDVQ